MVLEQCKEAAEAWLPADGLTLLLFLIGILVRLIALLFRTILVISAAESFCQGQASVNHDSKHLCP